MPRTIAACLLVFFTAGAVADDLDVMAARYLVLELSLGRHDPAQVDAYFGPGEFEAAAEAAQWGLDEILERAATLNTELAQRKSIDDSAGGALRIRHMQERLRALSTRAHMAQGTRYPFDEESRLLFGASAPHLDEGHFEAVLAEIDALLPGEGSLEARVTAFRDRFAIPVDRLPEVFDAAIAECRRRTLAHMELPDGESFRVEYVSDQPWSGY
ncbi:MAG: hypothetical protein GWN54_00815, partial [Gammaproteobacteria bacterium]|nr:hypothetical protein [Gammaproteobacteria bacterium]